MKNLIISPYYIYIFTFGIIFLVYSLNWSNLFPPLSLELVVFFFITFIIAFFLGYIQNKIKPFNYQSIDRNKKSIYIIVIILLLFIIEFIENGGIPLLLIIQKTGYDVRTFGIKSIHPIIFTFSSFYAVYLFHQFVSFKNKTTFLLFLLLLAMSILIYSRAALLMTLTSCFFVFVFSRKSIKPKIVIKIIFIVLILLYLFGVTGNLRFTNGKTIKNDNFLKTSAAKNDFIKSNIPNEYMWTYIYVSSPVANLQNNILKNSIENLNFKSFLCFEILPDFIAKRFGKMFNIQKSKPTLIVDWLNAVSVYSRSYTTLGWFGMMLMFGLLMFIVSFYIFILKENNDFYITGIAILNSFVIYNSFDNMIFYSGISLQLIYPLLSMYIKRIRIKSILS